LIFNDINKNFSFHVVIDTYIQRIEPKHVAEPMKMDVMLDVIISKFKPLRSERNKCKLVLEEIKKSMTPSLMSSSSSLIFNNDTTFLKMFENNKTSFSLYKNEHDTYKKIETITELDHYVPRLIDSSENYHRISVSFMLIENRGIDGLEHLNNRDMTFDNWLKFLVDISAAITILHKNNITHCDIKPENVVYSSITNRWSLIDFGFAGKNRTNDRFYGTVPYASPHICDMVINARTVATTSGDIKFVDDIYAFAMSSLALFGYYYHTKDHDDRIIFDIKHLLQIYHGNISNIRVSFMPKDIERTEWLNHLLKLLVSMVLSQLYTNSAYIVWDKKTCKCSFKGHTDIPCDMVYDITKYWNEFLTIITNYKI
jgi:serine/threonine protein kinase